MDIRSIISEDTDQQNRAAHHAPPRQSPVHSSPKASLHHPQTHAFPSPTMVYHHSVGSQAQAYQQPPYQNPPISRQSLPTYGRPSPSPYPQLTTAIPTTYNAHVHGQPSASPSSASAPRPTSHSLTESPMSSSSYSHPAGLNHAPLQSHPTTPLGPPLSYNRSASYMSREPQSPYDHHRTLSNASHGAPVTTPRSSIRGHPAVVSSPGVYDTMSPNIERNGSEYSINRERERSVSVSPKTKVPSRSQSMESRHASHDFEQVPLSSGNSLRSILHPSPQPQPQSLPLSQFHPQPVPPTRESSTPSRAHEPPPQTFHNHSPPRSSFSHPSPKTTVQPSPKIISRPLSQPSPQPTPQRLPNSVSPTTHRMQLTTPPAPKHLQGPPSRASPAQPLPPPPPPPGPPQIPVQPPSQAQPTQMQPTQINRKRKRHDPTPIWAQKANSLNAQWVKKKRTASPAVHSAIQPVVQQSNHQNPQASVQSNGNSPAPIPVPTRNTTSDTLEPNFANFPPYDEVTRKVMDFLWRNVVDMNEAETEISHFEIEAKLGVLIDRNTNQRIYLPVENEVVLKEGVFNVMFQSDMSERYHQTYNEYLNKETSKSNQNPQRVPIKYEHKRTTDSFYELPQAGFSMLPEFARRNLNPRTTKVRVTKDSKTGLVLAKIIKLKVANLEMHFPAQDLDVRISVNVEIDYPGGVEDLEYAKEEGRRQASRVKDRLCYHHQHCEVDLTQVTRAEDGVGGKGQPKTHEVEVELDASAIRREGQNLAQAGSSQFEGLVTAFMGHIRELVRTELSKTQLV